ncbi:MAG: DUF6531 domain-containing protein, partial [Chloroflexales bacterium]|nr:DUF6531 domain-containing protein [Chloroflexales bacterium]
RGVDRLPGAVNYLSGNNPDDWQTDLSTYGGVLYQAIYPGIDLRYDGAGGQLKSTYLVAPGADPGQIRRVYTGVERIRVDSAGQLVVPLAAGAAATLPLTLTEQAPIAWQEQAGARVPVAVAFTVADDGTVGFALGGYDPTRPLVIDPTLTYSSYLGGSGDEDMGGVALGPDGTIALIGRTASTDFPITPGGQSDPARSEWDVFVTRLSADGRTLLSSTYLGGRAKDRGYGIAVATDGALLITGYTESSDFPTANAYQPTKKRNADTFVTKLAPDGRSLVFSTFLGGNKWDVATDIALDANDQPFITGMTQAHDFPTTPGAYQTRFGGASDAFVTAFTADGRRLVYSTYLGGAHRENADYGYYQGAIVVDDAGRASITGLTRSTDFPTTPGVIKPSRTTTDQDAFVAAFTPDGGALVFSTYLGGRNDDRGVGVALDPTGAVAVTGTTRSSDFPVQNAFQPRYGGHNDAFVTTLSADGRRLLASTYLGGSHRENPHRDIDFSAIAVDGLGRIFVTGFTQSRHFPLVNPLQSGPPRGRDIYVTVFAPDRRTLHYSTLLGGRGNDLSRDMVLDARGRAIIVGETGSTDFPLVNPVQATHRGRGDAFVAIITETPLPADQNWAPESAPLACSQPCRGGPVNTRSGNLWTSATDLTVASPGPPLSWTRSYASQATDDPSGPLGAGWQHPFATRVITATMPSGEPDTVIVVSPKGNRLRFADQGDGQFAAAPGVYDQLAQRGGDYTLTMRDQTQHVFAAATGRLTTIHDPQGRTLELSYDGDGRL